MTITQNQSPIDTTIDLETEESFDWKNYWYPVTFIQDFENNHPYRFSLFDEPLVLFRDQTGKIGCVSDRCSHRAAKLSEGQLIEGKLECLYHGWQFNRQGECVHIPQLETGAKIPRNACIHSFPVVEHQGIVWIWRGQPEAMDKGKLPKMDILQEDGVFCIDTVIDLPADYTYLIENGVDPAHVPISHDGTELGVTRLSAAPLEMEVKSVSHRGFSGQYRGMNAGSNAPWTQLEYIAPYLLCYDFNLQKFGKLGGIMIYFLPLGKNRTRVFVRRYGRNLFPRWFKWQPRWLEHIRQNKVLEEDLFLILSEAVYVENSGKTLKEVFLPLKTSDVFVLEYRKWLDRYGTDLPSYEGYTTAKRPEISHETPMTFDRFSRHTQLCHSCNQAYKNTQRVQKIALGIAIALAAITLLSNSYGFKVTTVSLSLVALIVMVLARKIQTQFEQIYTR